LIVDSSTLISLEKANLLNYLSKINYNILVPQSVAVEIGDICRLIKNLKIVELKGRTLKISKDLMDLSIGSGESDCVALAFRLKKSFVICDDRKLLRQIFFSSNRGLRKIKILGFGFFLHVFRRENFISDVWDIFHLIIEKNNWERSEVQVANYSFLKEMGY